MSGKLDTRLHLLVSLTSPCHQQTSTQQSLYPEVTIIVAISSAEKLFTKCSKRKLLHNENPKVPLLNRKITKCELV